VNFQNYSDQYVRYRGEAVNRDRAAQMFLSQVQNGHDMPGFVELNYNNKLIRKRALAIARAQDGVPDWPKLISNNTLKLSRLVSFVQWGSWSAVAGGSSGGGPGRPEQNMHICSFRAQAQVEPSGQHCPCIEFARVLDRP